MYNLLDAFAISLLTILILRNCVFVNQEYTWILIIPDLIDNLLFYNINEEINYEILLSRWLLHTNKNNSLIRYGIMYIRLA